MTDTTHHEAPTMRPIFTRAELAAHQVDEYGRDYRYSDDGYGDMEVAARSGWEALAGWGADGWDLGDWPYVVISHRSIIHVYGLDKTTGQRYPYNADLLDRLRAEDRDFYEVEYEMRQTVEGDTTVYRFTTPEDRDAATDYLFVWYAIGRELEDLVTALGGPVWDDQAKNYPQREALDAGTLRVPERFRGPFRWTRASEERDA